MLIDIKKVYVVNLNNQILLFILKNIDIYNNYLPSLFVILSNCEIITNWFSKDLSENTRIVISNTGFIFDQIAVEWLKHFIKHTNVDSKAKWKLLFLNNHNNYTTSEFNILAQDSHI